MELKDSYVNMKFRSVPNLNIFGVKKEFEECKKVCAFYRDKKEIEKKIMRMIKQGKDSI
jgi:HAD superfamily hydrolase (TIGR01544 family)